MLNKKHMINAFYVTLIISSIIFTSQLVNKKKYQLFKDENFCAAHFQHKMRKDGYIYWNISVGRIKTIADMDKGMQRYIKSWDPTARYVRNIAAYTYDRGYKEYYSHAGYINENLRILWIRTT
jgi:hypothetical protein